MPVIDALSWSLWGLTISVQFALAVVLVIRGCHRQWVGVCVFCWFNAASSLVLMAAFLNAFGYDRAPAIYFYGFWAKQVINSGLQLWIIVELGCSVAPAITKVLNRLIPALAFVYVAGATYVVGTSPLAFPLFETRVAISMERVTSLALVGLFLCLTYAADAIGVKWRRQSLGVAIGFTFLAIAETSSSWLMGQFPSWYWISNARDVVWILAFTAWSITFLRSSPDEGPPDPREILSLLDMLKTAVSALRYK